MEKIVLKKYIRNNYFFTNTNSVFSKGDIVVLFLTDSYDGNFIRQWFANDQRKGLDKNRTALEKKQGTIVFTDIYDDREQKSEFTVSRATFLKILDEWEQARSEAREYIVIEVSGDNNVHIYATDEVVN